MEIDEAYNSVAEELKKLKIMPANDPCMSCNEVMDLSAEVLEDTELVAFEELLERISTYNMFLKSQKGSFEAQLVIIGSNLTRLLYLETQKIEPKRGSTWLTREEKEALVLDQNNEISSLNDQVIKTKALLAKIKDIPFAIDKKLDILKMKYRRMYGSSGTRN